MDLNPISFRADAKLLNALDGMPPAYPAESRSA